MENRVNGEEQDSFAAKEHIRCRQGYGATRRAQKRQIREKGVNREIHGLREPGKQERQD
jgi:hypothetical protein